MLLLATVTAVPVAPAEADPPRESAAGTLDVVVLVDESRSLGKDDLRQEIRAVEAVAATVLGSRSSMEVIGFASSPDSVRSNAVDVVCPSRPLVDAVARRSISDCARKLRIRTAAQGADTDHASALLQALGHYETGGVPGATRVVLMLTDGTTDVQDSPAWGPRGTRSRAAAAAIDERLSEARAKGIQIWPLGFGKVDREQLAHFAAGGASGPCAKPTARIFDDSETVVVTLLGALASASCAELVGPVAAGPGGSATVSVPGIATDLALVGIQSGDDTPLKVLQPSGRRAPATGADGESRFSSTTTDGEIQGLSVEEPATGTWRVTGGSEGTLTLLGLWRGVVATSLYASPPSPRPGTRAVVSFAVMGERLPLRPGALSDLRIDVTATTAGGRTMQVPVNDDGRDPDSRASDGVYSGWYDLPAVGQRVDLVGTVSGRGVMTRRTTGGLLATLPDEVPTGLVQIDVPDQMFAGDETHGRVTVRNPTDREVDAVLRYNGPPTLRLAGDVVVRARAGGKGQVDFTLKAVRDGARLNLGTLTLTDGAGDDLHTVSVTTRIRPRTDRTMPWVVSGAGLLVLLLAVGWLLRHRRRTRDTHVRGLCITLVHPDGNAGARVVGPRLWRSTMHFHLVFRKAGAPSEIRRGKGGGERVWFTVRRTGDAVHVNGGDRRIRLDLDGTPYAFVHDLALMAHRSAKAADRARATGRATGRVRAVASSLLRRLAHIVTRRPGIRRSESLAADAPVRTEEAGFLDDPRVLPPPAPDPCGDGVPPAGLSEVDLRALDGTPEPGNPPDTTDGPGSVALPHDEDTDRPA